MRIIVLFLAVFCMVMVGGCGKSEENGDFYSKETEAVTQEKDMEKDDSSDKGQKEESSQEKEEANDVKESKNEEKQENIEDSEKPEGPGEPEGPEKPEGTDNTEVPESEEESENIEDPTYSPQLAENELVCVNAGYYVVTATTNGGYQILVKDGEFTYGAQLLREYLNNMNCGATHIGGGCIDAEKNWYRCYVNPENIYVIDTGENDW